MQWHEMILDMTCTTCTFYEIEKHVRKQRETKTKKTKRKKTKKKKIIRYKKSRHPAGDVADT